jgi:aminocarboxymuconate-semialdehyde decarboxylase
VLPRKYFDRMLQVAPAGMTLAKRMSGIPALVDVDLRLRMMDRHEGYVQVLTIANPPIEVIAGPDRSPELARLANDEMAALVRRYPDRFPGFVASLPMNNPDAALREIDRAIDDLGATGVQVYTNVNQQPLDRPEYLQILERMARRRLPVWMHPARAALPDYAGEPRSKFDLWWAFGWPYETSNAMGRLVFSGIFDRHPELVVITHHMGAMIPFCAGRIGGGLDQLGSRSDDPEDAAALSRLKKRPIDYFRMFYGDTALFGAWHAMESGLAFFGADHVLFGTDFPFDPEKGPGFIRDTIAAMERMRASTDEKALIYEGNARRLLRLRGV